MRLSLIAAIAGVSVLAAGCATVVPLTDGGAQVREISSAQAQHCTFVRTVSFTDTLMGTGKTPGLVHQDGENGIRDDVAAAGGNAYVSDLADADWFFGHVNYTAEAYRCP
jgi:hypothetical protein